MLEQHFLLTSIHIKFLKFLYNPIAFILKKIKVIHVGHIQICLLIITVEDYNTTL